MLKPCLEGSGLRAGEASASAAPSSAFQRAMKASTYPLPDEWHCPEVLPGSSSIHRVPARPRVLRTRRRHVAFDYRCRCLHRSGTFRLGKEVLHADVEPFADHLQLVEGLNESIMLDLCQGRERDAHDHTHLLERQARTVSQGSHQWAEGRRGSKRHIVQIRFSRHLVEKQEDYVGSTSL